MEAIEEFFAKKGKKSISELTLDERLELLSLFDFTASDATYEIVRDFIMRPQANIMTKELGLTFRAYDRAGGGLSGSDITEIGLGVPRTEGSRLKRFFFPFESYSIRIKGGMTGFTVLADEQHRKYAEEIKRDYDLLLRDRLGIRMYLKIQST